MGLLSSRKMFRFTIVILFKFLSIGISMTFFKLVSIWVDSKKYIMDSWPFAIICFHILGIIQFCFLFNTIEDCSFPFPLFPSITMDPRDLTLFTVLQSLNVASLFYSQVVPNLSSEIPSKLVPLFMRHKFISSLFKKLS